MTDNTQFYKIGLGAAQVANLQPLISQRQKYLDQQRAQRQMELKQVADQQAQLKPDGLRNDPDTKTYFDKVGTWKQLSIQAQNTQNMRDKAQLQAQADLAYKDAQAFVNKSKLQGEADRQWLHDVNDNAKRHQWTEDAIQKGLAGQKLGLNDPNRVDYANLERAADFAAFDKKNKELHNTLMTNSQEQTTLGMPISLAGQTYIPKKTSKSIKQEDLAAGIMDETVDPNYQLALEKRFPDIYANAKTPDDYHVANALAASKLAATFPLTRDVSSTYDKPGQTDDEKASLHARNRLFDVNHPIPGAGGVAGQYTPAQTLIYGNPATKTTGLLQGDPNAVQKALTLIPKGLYGNAQPKFSIDPVTQEHVFEFPAQVIPDKKAIEANKLLRNNYEKSPEKTGIMSLYGDKIPFEQSTKAKKLLPETINATPPKTYRLNPQDPYSYGSGAAQMLSEQKVDLPRLNQTESIKGGHGVIQPASTKGTPHTTIKVPAKQKLY